MHNLTQSMRFIIGLTALLAASQAVLGSGEWYSRGGVQYEKRLKLTLQNPLPVERSGEPVVIQIDTIRKVAPDFPGKAWVVVDPAAAPDSPCGIEVNGNDMPSQVDDLDGDGTNDELVVLATLSENSTKTYFIYYTNQEVPRPLYPRRTQITSFEADTNTLFGIESDSLIFRLIRSSPGTAGFVGDMFGKYKAYPGYSQHLFNPVIANFDFYMKDTPWGRCVLNPMDNPSQLGLGALVARQGDKILWPQGPEAKITGKIIANGPIRSMGRIQIAGWEVGDQKYHVTACFAMFAGHGYMTCDLVVSNANGRVGDTFSMGMMKIDNETREISAKDGYALCWGDRTKIGAKDVGLGLMCRPGNVSGVRETDEGCFLDLKNASEMTSSLSMRLYFVGAWKSGGYVSSKEEFFATNKKLLGMLKSPVIVKAGEVESGGAPVASKEFRQEKFYLSNTSNKTNALPVEVSLACFGYQLKGPVKAMEKEIKTDTIVVDDVATVLIQKPIAPLKTVGVTLQAGGSESKAGFEIKVQDADGDGVPELSVSVGKATWTVTRQGLARVESNGKVFEIEQNLKFTAKPAVLHNGQLVAVVRLSDKERVVDYWFFKDREIVKINTNTRFDMIAKDAASYVAKREVGPEGCEKTNVNPWGRIASDKVFDKTVLLYPAEWAAVFSEQKQIGLVVYGTPSADKMEVVKQGKVSSAMKPGGRNQEIYLAVADKVAQGEDLYPLMSSAYASISKDKDFIALNERTGNGMTDAILVKDRNGNNMPDFTGDKWLFDADSDDALQMVLDFDDEKQPDGNVEQVMKVYCDTISGSELHSNHLNTWYGDLPTADYMWVRFPKERGKYDGCLGIGELQKPFYTFQDWDKDGEFFKGPITEGGFISSARVVDLHGGPYFWHSFVGPLILECMDLDNDKDNDIWLFRSPKGNIGGGDTVLNMGYVYFDLSDNNLEPTVVINPYAGRAYWALKYYTMLLADNGKSYQQGLYDDNGRIIGGQNWPGVGTWDVDDDGIAEGHLYVEFQHMLALDLNKPAPKDDVRVLEHRYFQRSKFYYQDNAHRFNFGILAEQPERKKMGHRLAIFPTSAFEDSSGHKISICAPYLPPAWHGEKLVCKNWPDGQLDYTPVNGWNTYLDHKHPFLVICHFRPGLFWHGHEGSWDQIYFNPNTRVEIDAEGLCSFYLYYSQIINGLHYKGLKFGLQFMHDKEDQKKVNQYMTEYRQKRHGDEYGNPMRFCNDYPPETRQKGLMFLYYVDVDLDGYVDTYLLDDENNGSFEKRIWYDKAKGILTCFDSGEMGIVKKTMEYPGYRLELKNYNDLVKLYKSAEGKEALLRQLRVAGGKMENSGEPFSCVLSEDWTPKIGVDIVHRADEKDLWSTFRADGLDTLNRVLSEAGMVPVGLNSAYDEGALSKLDMLVVCDISKLPSPGEVTALKKYVTDGGVLLLLAGSSTMEELAIMTVLAGEFGVEIGREEKLKLTPAGESKVELAKDATGGTLLAGVKPFYCESRDVKGGNVLLEYSSNSVIVEKPFGKGKMIVVPSNLFHNKYMCLPAELRLKPEKPGNQQLAANLVAHLLRDKKIAITSLDYSNERAIVGLSGKGGKVHFQVPWTKAAIEVNGKKEPAETKGGMISVVVSSGAGKVVITPKK